MLKINEQFRQIFSAVAKMLLHNMTQIEKRKVEFSVLCHLVSGEFNIRWRHLTFSFNFIIYIVQLCKDDCTSLWICRAVALASTEQLV